MMCVPLYGRRSKKVVRVMEKEVVLKDRWVRSVERFFSEFEKSRKKRFGTELCERMVDSRTGGVVVQDDDVFEDVIFLHNYFWNHFKKEGEMDPFLFHAYWMSVAREEEEERKRDVEKARRSFVTEETVGEGPNSLTVSVAKKGGFLIHLREWKGRIPIFS